MENALASGGNVSSAELANSIATAYPGVAIESLGPDSLAYSYECSALTMGVATDPSGKAYAPVRGRLTRREVTVGRAGVTEITSRDIDPTPGRAFRPGRVTFEPYQDPVTGESLFTDSNGAHYTLPGKMHTYMQGTDGNWVIGQTLTRTYTRNTNGAHQADPTLGETLLQSNTLPIPRRDELVRATNVLFPGEAEPQAVLDAVVRIRQMVQEDASAAGGHFGDIYVDDLPNGSTVVGFQFAQDGRIWMYQYVVGPDGYTTHYGYGRTRIFASPADQEHDEAVEGWAEFAFDYAVDPADGQKRMSRLQRTVPEEIEYGVAAPFTKVEDYTYTHIAVGSSDYVITNVRREEIHDGVPTQQLFNFYDHVVSPLVLDLQEGSPITMVQTQTAREERADDSVPKYNGEKFRRYYHYGFVSNEDLSIPLIVVEAADGTLRCEIDTTAPFELVPTKTK